MKNTQQRVISFVISLAIVITITAFKFTGGTVIIYFVKNTFGWLWESLAG
ncbi:hypothetical protein [Bacillus norwichensis]|uniref:Uncharacterized protein n=1 Tax=Bacillus norwichensis TaxID=2762217 RepID=A0ABR8VIZ2_9BACI|nr:hypothetical protein [Bacillus norwichensis]MBD8004714.1 hypothetical protein [Bacillus norwichensis]